MRLAAFDVQPEHTSRTRITMQIRLESAGNDGHVENVQIIFVLIRVWLYCHVIKIKNVSDYKVIQYGYEE